MASNPAFSPNNFIRAAAAAKAGEQTTRDITPAQLDELYGRPSATPADTERMTYEDTIVKTVITLGATFIGGAIGFFVPLLALPALLIGTVLAFVNIFKKKPSAALVLAYGLFQGIAIGGFSGVLERALPGIIGQALLATGLVIGVTLALFASGKIRASAKATKVFLIAMIAYAAFSLVNFGLMVFGVSDDPWGLRGAEIFGIPFGLIIAPLVILLGAYSLVLDFTDIKQGVEQGAPRNFAWKAAFGLVLTIIWLYV
ncbi:MAG TPA: Bax inhibitor-1/YccA family protein, partial [Rhodoglobus sp.]|nr:Bax inhibitor-1/YccA family protein [Rhodoglobus sp.]